jgi:hypothetical protein
MSVERGPAMEGAARLASDNSRLSLVGDMS